VPGEGMQSDIELDLAGTLRAVVSFFEAGFNEVSKPASAAGISL
jgi:hypothetical protein